MRPRQTLTAFDAYLAQRGLRLEAVVIGGTALNLLGIVVRPTDDCDILHPPLGDCLALAPTAEELRALLPWVAAQDAHPGWPSHVGATFDDLASRLGHGV
jgi:hypothetical protein